MSPTTPVPRSSTERRLRLESIISLIYDIGWRQVSTTDLDTALW